MLDFSNDVSMCGPIVLTQLCTFTIFFGPWKKSILEVSFHSIQKGPKFFVMMFWSFYNLCVALDAKWGWGCTVVDAWFWINYPHITIGVVVIS
jgi:hypothetical protein